MRKVLLLLSLGLLAGGCITGGGYMTPEQMNTKIEECKKFNFKYEIKYNDGYVFDIICKPE